MTANPDQGERQRQAIMPGLVVPGILSQAKRGMPFRAGHLYI